MDKLSGGKKALIINRVTTREEKVELIALNVAPDDDENCSEEPLMPNTEIKSESALCNKQQQPDVPEDQALQPSQSVLNKTNLDVIEGISTEIEIGKTELGFQYEEIEEVEAEECETAETLVPDPPNADSPDSFLTKLDILPDTAEPRSDAVCQFGEPEKVSKKIPKKSSNMKKGRKRTQHHDSGDNKTYILEH